MCGLVDVFALLAAPLSAPRSELRRGDRQITAQQQSERRAVREECAVQCALECAGAAMLCNEAGVAVCVWLNVSVRSAGRCIRLHP